MVIVFHQKLDSNMSDIFMYFFRTPVSSSSSRIGCIILLIVAMQMVEVREAWIYTYYRSRFGTIVVSEGRVC